MSDAAAIYRGVVEYIIAPFSGKIIEIIDDIIFKIVLSTTNSTDLELVFRFSDTEYNVANFGKFSLPLIKRAYPQLIAQQIVSVQPISPPAALIYYLRHRHATITAKQPPPVLPPMDQARKCEYKKYLAVEVTVDIIKYYEWMSPDPGAFECICNDIDQL